MKLIILLFILLGMQSVFENEMPMSDNMNEKETLNLLETLFEEGEMQQINDPLTGELTGFKFTHESINDSEELSFNVEEMK